MKARNNKTGEIVTNFNLSYEYGTLSYINSVGNLCIANIVDGEWTIIDESDDKTNDFDWVAFRRNMARDILISLVGSNYRFYTDNSYDGMAISALNITDALIKRLKGDSE